MKTLADGNCAFNAFALGIHFLYINSNGEFGLPEGFINLCVSEGEWASEDEVYEFLNEDAESSRDFYQAPNIMIPRKLESVQRALAPLLRKYAIQFLRSHHEVLDSEFESYIGMSISSDEGLLAFNHNIEISRKVSEIIDQGGALKLEGDQRLSDFSERNTDPLEQAKHVVLSNNIREWWNQEGRDVYFRHMEQNVEEPNDISRWGSQVELDILASSFVIALQFQNRNETYELGCRFGSFSIDEIDNENNKEILRQNIPLLRSRNIIDEKNGRYYFKDHFDERVGAVPQCKTLLDRLNDWNDQGPLYVNEWLDCIGDEERIEVRDKLSGRSHSVILNDAVLKISEEDHRPDKVEIKRRITRIDDGLLYILNPLRKDNPVILLRYTGNHWEFKLEAEAEVKNHTENESSILSFDSDRDSYEGIGLKSSLHGVKYQIALLLLIFKRAADKNLKFRLSTEWDRYEKFDDAVIEFEDEEGKKFVHAYQAKHKQDDDAKISENDLLNDKDGPFSILKYFKSFLKIKSNKREFEIGNLVLYTNAGLETDPKVKNIDLNLVLKEVPNDQANEYILVDDSSSSKQYKFKAGVSSDLAKLKEKLEQASCINRIVNLLVRSIKEGGKLDFTSDDVKEFHVALANGVINTETRKFERDFLEKTGSSQELSQLRERLVEKLKLDLQNCDEQKINKKLYGFEFKLHKKFGVTLKKVSIPKLTCPEKTAQEFCKYFDKESTIKIERRNSKYLWKKELDNLNGHVLVNSEVQGESKFSSHFVNNQDLKGNLKEFRNSLLIKLNPSGNDSFNFSQIRIKIKGFSALDDNEDGICSVYDRVIDGDITDVEMEKFLSCLILAVNQPNEVSLSKLLSDELGVSYNLLDSDFIANAFEKEMFNWLKQKQGVFLTGDDWEVLRSFTADRLDHLALSGYALEYKSYVSKSGIVLKDNAILQFPYYDWMNNNDEKILHILCPQSTWLTGLKLYSYLDQNESYKSHDAILFLKIRSALLLTKRLEKLSDRKVIIIDADEFSLSDYNDLLELNETIINYNDHLKILILINNNCADMVSANFDQYTDSTVSVKDLDEKAVSLLKSRKILINGEAKTMESLLPEGFEFMESALFLEMLSIPSYVIEHIKLPTFVQNGFQNSCYINRHLERSVTLSASKDELTRRRLSVFYISKFLTNEGSKSTIKLLTEKSEECNSIRLEKGLKDKEKEAKIEIIKSYLNGLTIPDDENFDRYLHLITTIFTKFHIFSLSLDGIKWLYSKGGVSDIKNFIDKTDDRIETINEKKFFSRSNVKIISAGPGMGKTSLVHSMIRISSGISRLSKIHKIQLLADLKSFINVIKEYSFTSSNDLINFFMKIYNLDFISTLYLKDMFKAGFVNIYLDGYDEIDSVCQNTIIQMIDFICSSYAKVSISIATRRHLKDRIQESLSAFAFELVPLSKEDQVVYLERSWSKIIAPNDSHHASKIYTYSEAAVNYFQDMFASSSSFLEIPLHLAIFAEAFMPDCRAFIRSSNPTASFFRDINIIDLYAKLIDNKVDIYLCDKLSFSPKAYNMLLSSLRSDILKSHIMLSFHMLYESYYEKLFSGQGINLSANEFCAMGLVEHINEKYSFIHRTFAEYFISRYVVQVLSNGAHPNGFADSFIEFIFVIVFSRQGREVILQFIESILSNHSNSSIPMVNWRVICLKSIYPTKILRPLITNELFEFSKNISPQGIVHSFSSNDNIPPSSFLDTLILKSTNASTTRNNYNKENFKIIFNFIDVFINFYDKLSALYLLKMIDTMVKVVSAFTSSDFVWSDLIKLYPKIPIVLRCALTEHDLSHKRNETFDKLKNAELSFLHVKPSHSLEKKKMLPMISAFKPDKFLLSIQSISLDCEWSDNNFNEMLFLHYCNFQDNENSFLQEDGASFLIDKFDKYKNNHMYRFLLTRIDRSRSDLINPFRYSLFRSCPEMMDFFKMYSEGYKNATYPYDARLVDLDLILNSIEERYKLTPHDIIYLAYSDITLNEDQMRYVFNNHHKCQSVYLLLSKLSTPLDRADIDVLISKIAERDSDYLQILPYLYQRDKGLMLTFNNINCLYDRGYKINAANFIKSHATKIILACGVFNFNYYDLFYTYISQYGQDPWRQKYALSIFKCFISVILYSSFTYAPRLNAFAFVAMTYRFMLFLQNYNISTSLSHVHISNLFDIFNHLYSIPFLDESVLQSIGFYLVRLVQFLNLNLVSLHSSFIITDPVSQSLWRINPRSEYYFLFQLDSPTPYFPAQEPDFNSYRDSTSNHIYIDDQRLNLLLDAYIPFYVHIDIESEHPSGVNERLRSIIINSPLSRSPFLLSKFLSVFSNPHDSHVEHVSQNQGKHYVISVPRRNRYHFITGTQNGDFSSAVTVETDRLGNLIG